MHCKPYFTQCSRRKMAVKNPVSLPKNIISCIKLLHAHHQFACNISAKCSKDPVTAPRGVISLSMHYQPLFTGCSCQKMAKLKTL